VASDADRRRDALIRETFELDRDLAFRTFRKLHMGIPEIVQACPDPELREAMLRGFWNEDAEKRYPEYRQKTSGMSIERLLDLRADLIEQANGIGILEWQEWLAEAALQPANDNERGRER
jgi:hypothetical protein